MCTGNGRPSPRLPISLPLAAGPMSGTLCVAVREPSAAEPAWADRTGDADARTGLRDISPGEAGAAR